MWTGSTVTNNTATLSSLSFYDDIGVPLSEAQQLFRLPSASLLLGPGEAAGRNYSSATTATDKSNRSCHTHEQAHTRTQNDPGLIVSTGNGFRAVIEQTHTIQVTPCGVKEPINHVSDSKSVPVDHASMFIIILCRTT